MRRQNRSLKVCSFPSLGFFVVFLCFVFFVFEKKKMTAMCRRFFYGIVGTKKVTATNYYCFLVCV